MVGWGAPGAVAGFDSRRGAAVSFTLEATDGAARAGVIHTAHGDVPTPAFMPVGTKGTVKMLHPDEVRSLGAAIVLGNTYHLHFRPGDELIADLGGLHAFTGWSGPILTDSGGFQVFSLRETHASVDDEGVTFPRSTTAPPSASRPSRSRRSRPSSVRTSRCASTSAHRPGAATSRRRSG